RDVGGGFGMKGGAYPEEAVVIWAARRVGRPVKWIPSRYEALLGDYQARDQEVSAELALAADGKFLALRWTGLHDAFPYQTRTGWSYDTGNYEKAMAKCQALADWDGYAGRRTGSEAAGKRRGRGIVYYVENTGVFNERMELRFDPSGELTIVA